MTTIFDAEAQVLLAPRQTISASTTLAAIAAPRVGQLDTCTWVIDVHAISATGTTTFVLQGATTTAGPWTDVAEGVVPQTLPPSQVLVGFSGHALRVKSSLQNPGALRIDIRQTGSATITFSSWITKSVSGGIGLGVAGKDHISAPVSVGVGPAMASPEAVARSVPRRR
jgi:hypothetical protein